MQSAAAYSAAVAAHSTQAQPVMSSTYSAAHQQHPLQQLLQQAHISMPRAFAAFRRPELPAAQEEQKEKSRADSKHGMDDAVTTAHDPPLDNADPNALLTEEHVAFLLNHHMRTRQLTGDSICR